MTEKDIIKGCKKNDRKSQKALVDLYNEYLFRVVLRYVKNHEKSKDVIQSTWIKIFFNLDKFNSSGPFRAWIRRIAINESLSYIQKKTKWLDFDGLEDIAIKEHTRPIGLDNLLEEDIVKIIQELPDHYRIVFIMHTVDGFSHDEISKMLGIQKSSSRSRLLRAREKLKDLYLSKFQICSL